MCMRLLRTSSQMVAFIMTGRIASSSICARGKGFTLNGGKYRSLYLIEQAMKVFGA